jgi:hypothetical protein
MRISVQSQDMGIRFKQYLDYVSKPNNRKTWLECHALDKKALEELDIESKI